MKADRAGIHLSYDEAAAAFTALDIAAEFGGDEVGPDHPQITTLRDALQNALIAYFNRRQIEATDKEHER